MTVKVQEALEIALQLDRDERAELAEHLLASLEEESELPDGWAKEWAVEAERRSKDGPEQWLDGPVALRELFGSAT